MPAVSLEPAIVFPSSRAACDEQRGPVPDCSYSSVSGRAMCEVQCTLTDPTPSGRRSVRRLLHALESFSCVTAREELGGSATRMPADSWWTRSARLEINRRTEVFAGGGLVCRESSCTRARPMTRSRLETERRAERSPANRLQPAGSLAAVDPTSLTKRWRGGVHARGHRARALQVRTERTGSSTTSPSTGIH